MPGEAGLRVGEDDVDADGAPGDGHEVGEEVAQAGLGEFTAQGV